MADFETNGMVYHYLDQGQGLPLILLHGFTGSSSSWAEIIAAIGAHRRTIAIDLPGHGKTRSIIRTAHQSMQTVAQDILSLIKSLDLDKPDLLGYSMGGRLALILAHFAQDQFRTLILESASPGLESEAERQERIQNDELWAEFLEMEGIEPFLDRWERLPLFAGQSSMSIDKINLQRRIRLQNSAQGLAHSLRSLGTGKQPNLWPALIKFNLPTLLLVGELDQKYVAINQKMAQLIPNAKLHIFSASGHNIHFEHPKKFVQIVETFLNTRNHLAQAKEEYKKERK